MEAAVDTKKSVREYKKKLMLEAAAKLFAEKGFQKTTLDDIASSLNVTKPFVYTCFSSKYEILEELFDLIYKDLYRDVVSLLDSREGSVTKRFVEFIRAYVAKNIEHRRLIPILLEEEKNLTAEKVLEIRKVQKKFDLKLAALLANGVKDREFDVPDPMVTSLAISGMVRWVHRWYADNGRLQPMELCDEIAVLALKLAGAKLGKESLN